MRNKLILSLLLLLLVSLGCSTIPIDKPKDQTSNLPVEVVIRDEFEFYDMYETYLMMRITLRNNTDIEVDIDPSCVTLVDPQDNEHRAASVSRVLPTLSHNSMQGYSWYKRDRRLRDYIFQKKTLKPNEHYVAVAFIPHNWGRLAGNFVVRIDIPENKMPVEFNYDFDFSGSVARTRIGKEE